jgi:hypothetical protein
LKWSENGSNSAWYCHDQKLTIASGGLAGYVYFPARKLREHHTVHSQIFKNSKYIQTRKASISKQHISWEHEDQFLFIIKKGFK